jgi:hypothetical protein
MNEELTRNLSRAEIEGIAKIESGLIDGNIITCMGIPLAVLIQHLATALLAEMDKPKVWDGAPEWVNAARVRFFVNDRNDGHSEVFSGTYTRELPKTRARQIAEDIAHVIYRGTNGKDVEYVEGVLTKYAEELKGEA